MPQSFKRHSGFSDSDPGVECSCGWQSKTDKWSLQIRFPLPGPLGIPSSASWQEGRGQEVPIELANFNRWIAALEGEHRTEDVERGGDNTPFNDEGDAAEATEEQESRFELYERLIAKATGLDEALRRIHEGVYGICVHCGKAIHRQRLEALPDADLCLRCQLQKETSKTIAEPHAGSR